MQNETDFEECEVCNMLLKVCVKRGEVDFCKNLIKKLRENEITKEEFVSELSKLGEKLADEMVDSNEEGKMD